jgi:hypothetical protein
VKHNASSEADSSSASQEFISVLFSVRDLHPVLGISSGNVRKRFFLFFKPKLLKISPILLTLGQTILFHIVIPYLLNARYNNIIPTFPWYHS